MPHVRKGHGSRETPEGWQVTVKCSCGLDFTKTAQAKKAAERAADRAFRRHQHRANDIEDKHNRSF